MKKFNVTGLCIPGKHYMVDSSEKIQKITQMIDDGQYFTINRARQYGKTTTLFLLGRNLPEYYTCISLSFEGVGETMFSGAEAFCQRFLWQVSNALEYVDEEFAAAWQNETITEFDMLGHHISKLCKGRKVVLFIDEVDRASGNRVFLHFLGMLRSRYLARESGQSNAFHSVILAGVYDIRNIKLKLVTEGVTENTGRIYNSPWNIAAKFDVAMSFNPTDIASMLSEYENDHHIGMDIFAISTAIHDYTSGYPFLVSRICKCIDEELNRDWTAGGVQKAIKLLMYENNVLFDDMSKNLENNKELYEFLYAILVLGEKKAHNTDDPVVKLSDMYGYIKNSKGKINVTRTGYAVISNKIFALRLSNYFISKDSNTSRLENIVNQNLYQEIVKGNVFNMELCLRKFAEHYSEIFSEADAPFLERHGRLLFISYLRPLINGHGFYHIESQFTDLRRMDIVVDFGRDQFIIELKLWKGEIGKEKAYEQLLDYMDTKNAAKAYLLTFDFRKDKNKERKAEWVLAGDKQIFDVVV